MKKTLLIVALILLFAACKKSATPAPLSPIEIAFPRIDTATFWLTIQVGPDSSIRLGPTARISSDGTLTFTSYKNYKGGSYVISITDSVAGTTIKDFDLLYPGHSLTQYSTGNLLQIVRSPDGREYYDLLLTAGGPEPDSVVCGYFIDSL
jgi:hypothetical protein